MDAREKKLIDGLRAGKDSAYEELFRVHFPILKCMAENVVHDEFAAKTIVSDFFFHIWEIREDLRIGTSLRGYLARGVYNRCLNHLRSRQIGSYRPVSELTELPADETPLGNLLAKELQQEIDQAVSELPEATRNVFLLHRSEGLKYEDIAAETGISVNTVKYHIKRALAFLRKRFGKNPPALPGKNL